MPFHCVEVVLLIPDHAVLTVDFTPLTAVDTVLFIPLKVVDIVDLIPFQIVDVVLFIPFQAVDTTEETPLTAEETVLVIPSHAELKPEDMLSIIPSKEVLIEETISLIASVADELLLIPSAMVSIISLPQVSASAKGPSSGTEKCRKERILSATDVTASATA